MLLPLGKPGGGGEGPEKGRACVEGTEHIIYSL